MAIDLETLKAQLDRAPDDEDALWEIIAAVPTLIEVAEAAQAIDNRIYNQNWAQSELWERLRKALAKFNGTDRMAYRQDPA